MTSKKRKRGQLVSVVWPGHARIQGTPWESGVPWIARFESRYKGTATVISVDNGHQYGVPEERLVDAVEPLPDLATMPVTSAVQ